jgi:D-alanyl-D-alanine carboxypeptidase (penicillin-binding protein 5/6)
MLRRRAARFDVPRPRAELCLVRVVTTHVKREDLCFLTPPETHCNLEVAVSVTRACDGWPATHGSVGERHATAPRSLPSSSRPWGPRSMVGSGTPGKRRRAHTRNGLGREVEAHLVELGRQLPPPSKEEARSIAADRWAWLMRRLAVGLVVAVVVALVVGGMVQWFRPLPEPTLQATSIRVPGTSTRLPWPSTGEAALSVPGLVSLGQHRDSRPVPIGVLSAVLTAYVILKDHPLSTGGDTGPTIVVTPRTRAAYRTGRAAGEPEVPVSSGESLTELDSLEGLLIDSGSDMAILLADWDAGNTSAFVKKMDHYVVSLGLRHTRITEPSGAEDAMISTPSDLIRLAEAAMRIPVFQQIVSLGEINLPEAGLQYNRNFVLGENGVVGIEVGSDIKANGCYLFAAQKIVSGQTVTLYGVVLGQSGRIGPDAAAVDAGDALMKAALSDLTAIPIRVGRVVGQLSAPWGASTPVKVSQAVTVPAWPGLSVLVTTRLAKFTMPIAAGTRVGWLQTHQGSRLVEVALRNIAPLQGPSGLWRLTR